MPTLHPPMRNHPTCPAAGLRAFTLVELLTVIVIIGILAAIIIPTVGRVRETASAAQCIGNLRSMGVAVRLYSEDNKGRTPRLTYTFIQDLWSYAYPNTTVSFSGEALPEQLAGTMFECPLAHKDAVPFVTTKRSYGMNAALDPSSNQAERESRGILLSRVTQPSRAALIGDVRDASLFVIGTLNPRHNNKVNVCFVDGHAAAITITDELRAADAQANHVFWNGVGK
ncbi:prepilin-type N-terminal cleavage/methylation domain-containing protein [Opitutaceae bacterium TAV1]|nr:prepilin-type N-terminal cleavage/methylation domain-containing protein [Opitutaceae bacterium TAV1]